MKPIRRQSIVEQTTTHLLENLRAGTWAGKMPGVNALAAEFDVSRVTVRAALRKLEIEGLLIATGAGKCRIISSQCRENSGTLRVGILLNQPLVDESAVVQEILLNLREGVESIGHTCFLSTQSQASLGHKLQRITRYVEATPADAWIVSGAPPQLLQWFAAQAVPALAYGGRSVGVPIASVGGDVTEAISSAIRHLISLQHRRIVFVTPSFWRKPQLGLITQTYHNELLAGGITPSDYHLPDWEETPAGFQALLNSYHPSSRPTAFIVIEPCQFVATSAFLAQKNLQIPRDVSLICITPDPAFAWRVPQVAHFVWPNDALNRAVIRWIRSVHRGLHTTKQTTFAVRFIPCGTIASAQT